MLVKDENGSTPREVKRFRVELELRDHPGDSDREIGRRCGVDGKTVAKVRRELGIERSA